MKIKRFCLILLLFLAVSNHTNAFFFKKSREKRSAQKLEQANNKSESSKRNNNLKKSSKLKKSEEFNFTLDSLSMVNDSLLRLVDSLNTALGTKLAEDFDLIVVEDDDSFTSFVNSQLAVPIRFDTANMAYEEFDFILSQLLSSWAGQQLNGSDCFSESALAPVSDSIYMARLAKLPHIIEMPYNNVIKSFIEFYAQKNSEHLRKILGMKNYYFPIFEQALAAGNLPLELKYLPVIESALNTKAISRAGAAGLWQFMVGTGRMYGLEVNSLIDERMDPIKSSNAAVRFLKDLYSIYGDWNLAIAAYNCGPGNVNKAIRRSGGHRDFWKIYPYLPRETRSYLPIFVAANYVMNYHEEHNICPIDMDMSLLTDTIMINDRIHLEQVANTLDISIEQLRLLNPQYRKDIIPGDISPYSLCLPLPLVGAYIDKREDVMAYNAKQLVHNRRKEIDNLKKTPIGGGRGQATYRVVKGDTLGGIAKRHNVSVKNLRNWNNIKGSTIKPGQRLRVRA